MTEALVHRARSGICNLYRNLRLALIGFGALFAAGLVGCTAPISDVLDDAECAAADGCSEPVASVTEAITTHAQTGDWTCPAGVSCEDIYSISVGSNTNVRINVKSVTGSSKVRLAAFGPNTMATINHLTNDAPDWGCNASGPENVAFTAVQAGTYFLVVGRDGTSPGTSGTYSVDFVGSPSLTFLSRTANNQRNNRLGRACEWRFRQSAGFSCSAAGCQNVWDFDVPSDTVLTLTAGSAGPDHDLSLALWAPGIPLDGVSRFRGIAENRNCVARGIQESAKVYVQDAGRYRAGVVYESASSIGALRSGTYTMGFTASRPLVARGQTVSNGPRTLVFGPGCAYQRTNVSNWQCPTREACMDTYQFVAASSTQVTVEVDQVTGNSRSRLGVFAEGPNGGGVNLAGVNLLNGKRTDRQCVGPNERDFAVSSAFSGRFLVSLGREATIVGGDSGNYRITVRSFEPLFTTDRFNDNIRPAQTSTSCP